MNKQTIFETVCRVMEARPEIVLRANSVMGARKKELVEVRFWSMYFMKKYTTDSLDVIGGFFGRDHTTVLYAIKKIEESLLIYSESRILQGNIEIALIDSRVAEAEMILKTRLDDLLNEFTIKAKQIINEI